MDSEIVRNIIPAASGLLGVIIGSIFTFFSNTHLKSKEVKLKIVEKIFDKRLKAHEDILSLSKELRTTISTHSAKDGLNVDSYPAALASREMFDNLKLKFYLAVNPNSHWISIELFRLLNYVQDYLENVSQHLVRISPDKYEELGIIIRVDFIDLAAELEKETLRFFDNDIYNVNLKVSKGHHKWPPEYSISRLENTELIKNKKKILALK